MEPTTRTSSQRSGRITLDNISRRRFITTASGVLVPASLYARPPLSLATPSFVKGYTAAAAGGGVPTFDAGATTAAANNDFSEAFTTAGSNRLLVVVLAGWRSGAWTASGVTYNSVAMTRWRREVNGGDVCDLWYLVAPATGSNTVAASFTTAPTDGLMAIASFNGVNQSTPLRGSSAGGSTLTTGAWTASSSITSDAGDLVLIGYEWYTSWTLGGGQTSRASGKVTASDGGATIATAAGASTYTPSGTVGANLVWVGGSMQPT